MIMKTGYQPGDPRDYRRRRWDESVRSLIQKVVLHINDKKCRVIGSERKIPMAPVVQSFVGQPVFGLASYIGLCEIGLFHPAGYINPPAVS